ncbi:PREDICTED: uncharacterized protein LOC105956833 isoform X2 [Erythranthe guttata]|uniref:uncharacterized protein LOC105956833 isoform X2 n=1 Tax=Erythranthe guttata TaxID=4155 RepID=UPI00064D75AD|nr:PREDICTED: uncharacterized protein LOC105956833 isoform X2 [Erythranthe guttata]|eukprot:XP_012836195.1 PREDICTED: uncharacterized protein LOC105956833 isoform X2 [Erythranthe guttata]
MEPMNCVNAIDLENEEVLIQTSLLEEDMITEYSENINNEDGISPKKDAEAGLVVETDSDAKGEIPVLSKPSRGPRYFDPAGFSLPECNNNYDRSKKSKKKRKRCYICGDTRHEGQRCKQVNECFICSKKGHLVINCPNKKVEVDSTSKICLMCGSTGHDMFSCSSSYDSEDLKAIECYICGKVGHLCCAENKTEGLRGEGSCYNCGESGHFGPECPKLIEAANLLKLICSKCGDNGHSPQECTKPISAKKAKRMAREIRRQNMPTVNLSYQTQPRQTAGPYCGSNVWSSPAAAATARATQVPNAFNPLTLNGNEGKIPEVPLNQEAETILPQRATQNEQQNSFYPMTQVPHPMWDCKKGTQIPQPHLNCQPGIMLPQAEFRVLQNSLTLGTQIPKVPLNQQTGTMVPQIATQIQQTPFYPMTQPPHPTWDCNKGTQIPQPHNHQSGILLPQAEYRVPQNSSVLPAHPPHSIWNSGQRLPSRSTPVMIGQAGTQIPQHPLNHQAGIMLPHQVFNHQTNAPFPCQNRSKQT